MRRRINRRSFIASVAGGAAAGAGSLGLVIGRAEAGQVTDRDPSDPVGRGRGGGTGITDTDSGVGADPAGRGRGGGPRPGATGVTDSDPSDPVGRGRGASGITDSDTGPYADPRGRGRGGQRGPSDTSPPDREARCENNRRLYAELSRDGATPDTWSEGQLRVAQADLQAANGAINVMRQTTTADSDAQRAWAVIEPIARRYGIPVTRQGSWYSVTSELDRLIYRAESSSIRAERLRQLQQVRTNLSALGC